MAGKKGLSAFDSIMQELLSEERGNELLEDEMLSRGGGSARRVPLRYRIIALGFAEGLSVRELDQKLEENGLGKLYARSVWEAGLIFAFAKGRSYEEWKVLEQKCRKAREKLLSKEDILGGSSFTMEMLQEYIELNSEIGTGDGDDTPATRRETYRYRSVLTDELQDDEEFALWLDQNLQWFALSREKSRYYFCKYLYYFLEAKIDKYLERLEKAGEGSQEDLWAELVCFKGLTKLKRKKLTPVEIREELRRCPISSGAVFDEFNEFFFGYVSLDWMDVLLEYYGNLDHLDPKNRQRLLLSARHYDPKYRDLGDQELLDALLKDMEEREALEDETYDLESGSRGYQKDRGGENAVRKYVRGRLDPDRTSLICFLLFFAKDTDLPEGLRLDLNRLNRILATCGFRELTEEDDFDWFVLNFLKSPDPVDYLIEEVSRYAKSEENFYLYRLYQNSRSQDQDFEKIAT